jgi:hypothetical protein
MTVPNYLQTFRRAVREQEERATREREGYVLNALNAKSPTLNALNTFNASPPVAPYAFAGALDALEARCPEYIEPDRWQRCLVDAQHFIMAWGDQALALGWTAGELFSLHEPPKEPKPNYNRLSRYDATGLIWHLTGSRVVALAADTAAIQNQTTGNVLIYRKANKPALGPLGDSLDDFTG